MNVQCFGEQHQVVHFLSSDLPIFREGVFGSFAFFWIVASKPDVRLEGIIPTTSVQFDFSTVALQTIRGIWSSRWTCESSKVHGLA